ncbi:MAG: Fructose-2,6-bisphosphatase [Rhodobacteraceae bacterium HLUCCO07]|nr:MAG: Fructose-2,6-bisphosphatase [Rhodobacteraceae bacterium HLUCCO07]
MIRALCLILLSMPVSAAADDWDALKRPEAVALMRHALAPGTGDPSSFELSDCTTQRNLDARGRDQARETGAQLRRNDVQFDAVWTSQWCRSRDTADLMEMGAVEEVPALNSFFADRRRSDRQTAATLERIERAQGQRILMVTHQVNITALTGVVPQSGEIIVAQMRDDGELEVTGRVLIAP